jgi:hypothetical protein
MRSESVSASLSIRLRGAPRPDSDTDSDPEQCAELSCADVPYGLAFVLLVPRIGAVDHPMRTIDGAREKDGFIK